MSLKESTRNTLETVESYAWPIGIGSLAVDLLTALDTSGLTGIALTTALSSFAVRKTLLAKGPEDA